MPANGRSWLALIAICSLVATTASPHLVNQVTRLGSNAPDARESEEARAILSAGLEEKMTQAMFSVIRVQQVWKSRSKLTVCFGPLAAVVKPDDRTLIFRIEAIAKEWTADIPLKFDFGPNNLTICGTQLSAADIRIDIAPAGDDSHANFQSVVGNEAATNWILGDKPYSMQLRFPRGSAYFTRDNVFRFYVLHEFGHALGASHEHQKIDCDWNYPYLVQHFGFPSVSVAQDNLKDVFGYDASAYPTVGVRNANGLVVSPYDRYSVMQYNMSTTVVPTGDDPGVYKDGRDDKCFRENWVSTLTVYDKEGMKAAYLDPVAASVMVAQLTGVEQSNGMNSRVAAAPVPVVAASTTSVLPSATETLAPEANFALPRLQQQVSLVRSSPTAMAIVTKILRDRR